MIIYLAGPLFTMAEINWNTSLVEAIEEYGYTVLLPQDFCSHLVEPEEIARFCLEKIKISDAMLVNADGPDVDSGTSFEAGVAHALGIPIYTYRTDLRGGGDCEQGFNLMLVHNSRFIGGMCETAEQIAELLYQAIG